MIRKILRALDSTRIQKSSPADFVKFTSPRGVIRSTGLGGSSDAFGSNEVVDGFGACSWVYSCVMKLSGMVSSVPWVVQELQPGGTWEPNENAPEAQLLEYPHPRMSRKFLMQFQTLVLLLTGNSLFHRVADSIGANPELSPLSPRAWQPIADEAEWLYGFKNKNTKRELLADDVAHAMLANPNDPLWGVPPLKPISDIVAADIAAVQWNRAQLKNQGIPSGVLHDPNITDDIILKEAQQKVDERFGPGNAHKTIVIGGTATWQPTSLTPVEMDWLESQKFAVTRITAAYGLLPALFAPEAATYSNLQVAADWAWTNGAVPILDVFEDAFNLLLIPRKDRMRRCIKADLSGVPALQKKMEDKAEPFELFVNNGIPINEAISMLDLPVSEVEGGNESLVSASLIRLSDLGKPRVSGSADGGVV
jgi:HK97 family phage portal protein